VGGELHAPADLLPGNGLSAIVQGTGWPPGPFWRVRKISPPSTTTTTTTTGSRSSYRLAHSESLYPLHCAGSLLKDRGISFCLQVKGWRGGTYSIWSNRRSHSQTLAHWLPLAYFGYHYSRFEPLNVVLFILSCLKLL